MNLLAAWKKLLLFGFFGAVGCLAGCAVGEAYLAIASAATTDTGAGQGASLISKPVPPSAEAPLMNEDFRKRLEKAGAHTGDIQISLIWFNTNDLDLHCVDPKGFEISWQNKLSPSGGELDVDRNAGCRNPTVEPVENIYWPKDGAPMGRYQVYLDYFQQCPRGPDETSYQISVLHGGEREEFRDTITKGRTGTNKKLIYEFNLSPQVKVVAPPELQLTCGMAIHIPVAVSRSFYPGKLNLKAENLPEGVTAEPASIETGKNEGTIELKASNAAVVGKKVPFKIVATGAESPDVHGSADPQLEVIRPVFSLIGTIIIGIWTALLALGLCLALIIGQNRYLGRPLFARGRLPLAIMVIGAILAGFVSGSVGQSLFSLLLSIGVGSLGFLIGWILLGGLLGLGISYFVPNLDRKKAAIAGLVGGLLGAIGYLIWSNTADWLGRFAGSALLGFCIGLMVAIVEAAFRRIWLEVRYGERETIAVNLGPEPVKIGGDARACIVWARGAADVALRYFVRDGRVICEDATTRRESVVGNGDTRTVGTVTLIVHTGMGSTSIPRPLPRPSMPSPIPSSVPAVAGGVLGRTTPAVLPELRPPPPAAKPVPVASTAPKPTSVARPAAPGPLPAAPTAPAPRPPVPAPPASAKPPVPASAGPPKPPVPKAGSVPPKPPVPGTAAKTPPKPQQPSAPAMSPPPAPPKLPPLPTSRPPVPGTPAAAKPPLPAAPKPPVPPAASKPPAPPPAAPAAPTAGSAKTKDPNACPTCGRITPGRPGARFCMMCDKAY